MKEGRKEVKSEIVMQGWRKMHKKNERGILEWMSNCYPFKKHFAPWRYLFICLVNTIRIIPLQTRGYSYVMPELKP
jgi:hypothetical protein